MTNWDPSQQLVLQLDPTRHARVLGAPGSGKTAVLVESYARWLAQPGWSESDLLVLSANRMVAAQLRGLIEQRVPGPLGGTPVRTAASFAFAVLQRIAAVAGATPPRLLTGTAHDEAVAQAIEQCIGNPTSHLQQFSPEVLRGEAFRAEVRELSRVLDDFAQEPAALAALLQQTATASSQPHTPDAELVAHWRAACELLQQVQENLRLSRPDELPSSGLLRAAAGALAGDADVPVPRLVLVDDAQEVGEGELALLAALSNRGARVWVFGDPDIATGAFHGERTRLLAGVTAELTRRGAAQSSQRSDEQCVVLQTAHRHGPVLRDLVGQLSTRVGVAGAGAQRAAAPAERTEPDDVIQFATVPSSAEQLGVIAHRLRRRRLGLDGRAPLAWSDMAVICRSRGDVARVSRVLAGHQVPTSVAAGGVVLREHQLVRELILFLQQALGLVEPHPRHMWEMLGGVVGGVDPIALRRLRGEMRLQETRRARSDGRSPAATDAILLEAWNTPDAPPIVDSRAGRQLRKLARIAAESRAVHERGGTPREVLWAIWDGTGLAEVLQGEALTGRGAVADEAHRALDAVLALFFALQQHEEQDSDVPIAQLLRELLDSSVPRDTLAARSQRDIVTVTTPQGVIGREFAVVCVLGPQEGAWPNIRARGSLLGAVALERWLRGDPATAPSRRDTLHDELRLFIHSCARSTIELLAVAVADDDQHPSAFFGLGSRHGAAQSLPSSRLTLRGAVAEMRRRLTENPADTVARDSLLALARAGVPGAHPAEWYGVAAVSSDKPFVDLAGDPEATVTVRPSEFETAERCPLDWAISALGGGRTTASQGLGTLLHRAFETAQGAPSAEELLEIVAREWDGLVFEADWQSQRDFALAQEMARGLADYLAECESSDRTVVGREVRLSLMIERARIVGIADRLEAREQADGRLEVSVVDLKTGRRVPSGKDMLTHAQLQAYQLGIIHRAYEIEGGELPADAVNGGARLLYVHPEVRPARGGETFRQPTQPLLEPAAEQEFRDRVRAIAQVMAAGEFVARVEHHCNNPHALGGACRLHIVPAVSYA